MSMNRLEVIVLASLLQAGALNGCGGGGDTGAGGGDTTTETTTTTPTTTMTATTGTGDGVVYVGKACTADADCGSAGKCSRTDENDPVLGGGPAGGYCTKECVEDTDCPNGTCVLSQSGAAECFLNCKVGPKATSLNDPLDPDKCYGREDVRCTELESGALVCIPQCGSDAQCGDRACDPRLTVCVDAPTTGKAMGENCNYDAPADECAGKCMQIGPLNGPFKTMCTSPCVMGGEIETSFDCKGPSSGVCLYTPPGAGPGDLAFCAESCLQQDECQYPDFFCLDVGLGGVGLPNGVCIDSHACATDSDCKLGGTACVDTTLGKFCMSPKFPLGSLEPAGAGGSGGSMAGGAGGAGGM